MNTEDEKTDGKTNEPRPTTAMADISSQIWTWLGGLGDNQQVSSPCHDDHGGDGPDDNREDDVEEDVAPSLPNKRDYHRVIFDSVAYQWLTASLSKEILLAVVPSQYDVCGGIRSKILSCLEGKSRAVSSHRASERHILDIKFDWHPKDFLRGQFGPADSLGQLLGRVITLTGSTTDAQALPCEAYLCQTWPVSGPAVFGLLKTALESGSHTSGKSFPCWVDAIPLDEAKDARQIGELPDKSVVALQFTPHRLTTSVEGPCDSIAEVAELLGWLGAAVRATEKQSGASTCHPSLRILPGLGTPSSCFFEFSVDHVAPKAEKSDGQCWHELFQNPLVVKGYPIPRRARYDTGLEIPLEMMSALTRSPRINEFLGRYYLKGFSTAVVPTGKLDNATLWHLYCAEEGTRLSYPHLGVESLATNLGDLAKGRHILGWCTVARLYVGKYDNILAFRMPR